MLCVPMPPRSCPQDSKASKSAPNDADTPTATVSGFLELLSADADDQLCSARLIVDSLTSNSAVSSRRLAPVSKRSRMSIFSSAVRAGPLVLMLGSNPARRRVSRTVLRRTLYLLARE